MAHVPPLSMRLVAGQVSLLAISSPNIIFFTKIKVFYWLVKMPSKVKVAIIGYPNVGKTSFIRRFKLGRFQDELLIKDVKKISNDFSTKISFEEVSSLNKIKQSHSCLNTQRLKQNLRQDCSKSKLDKERERAPVKQKSRCPAVTCHLLFSTPKEGKSGERLVDVTFFDVPYLQKFPVNSLEEWEMEGAIGVRSADAFILLYDVTNEDSFEYVKRIRQEILQVRSHLNFVIM